MDTLVLDGKTFVKASKAADDLGYTADYVGQLCRSGKVSAHLVGRTWYVDVTQLGDHRIEKKRMSRVKAREQAHRAVEEQRTLRAQVVDESGHETARYEEDTSELIPEVRKLEVDAEKRTRTTENSPEEKTAERYTVENEGRKITMSGTLEVVDLNEDVSGDTSEETMLTPRILRKKSTDEKARGEKGESARVSESARKQPAFVERLKSIEEEGENNQAARHTREDGEERAANNNSFILGYTLVAVVTLAVALATYCIGVNWSITASEEGETWVESLQIDYTGGLKAIEQLK